VRNLLIQREAPPRLVGDNRKKKEIEFINIFQLILLSFVADIVQLFKFNKLR